MPNYLITFLLLFSCSLAQANEQEKIRSLSQDPHWHQLLHYTRPTFGPARSSINSADYFLAKDGRSDAEAEMKATIAGLSESDKAYCRFPSRRLWLEKMGWQFPKRPCSEYETWTRQGGVKSISLIFATGFLGNPASYFGHPLLKLNFKDDRSPQNLLDTAINYGAFTPPDVGALPYAIYGIFGGYNAGFTAADFFFHKNNYSELELRDLWEYELNLRQEQIDELVAHLWDLHGATIDYYFFSDNCAFRMSEILDLVLDKKISTGNPVFTIPVSVFHRLHDAGAVKSVTLLPSRQTRLLEKFSTLGQKEKGQLKQIVLHEKHLGSSEFAAHTESEKSKVLETAIDYYSYRMVKDETPELIRARKSVLRARLGLPPVDIQWKTIKSRPPHEAQKPVLTQLGFSQSEHLGRLGSFRFRPVLYDMVSPDVGRPRNSGLSVFDLDVNFSDKRIWVKSFNLISVESLNISSTGLPSDGGLAWRFKLGAEQLNLACDTCTIARFEGGVGKALELTDSLVFFAMIDPRIQSQHSGSGHLAATPSLSTLLTLSKDLRILASAGRRFYADRDYDAENLYSVETRIGSNRNWDIRTSFQEHVDRRYALAVGLYW